MKKKNIKEMNQIAKVYMRSLSKILRVQRDRSHIDIVQQRTKYELKK